MADPYDMNDRKRRPGGYSALQADSAGFRALANSAPTDPVVQGTKERAPGAYSNLDDAGQFRMPSVPEFGAGKKNYGSFSVLGAGKGTSADFSDVVGKADTVPDFTAGPKRRNVTQVTPENTDTSVRAGHVSENVSGAAERERQGAMSDLDSALFGLRSGGLNMRSKREMFTNLLGQKQDLTKQAYNATNERGQLNAKLDTDAEQTSANLREAAARRRGDTNMFNAEIGEKGYQFDTEQQAAADAAAAAAPFNKLKYLSMAQQLQANDAKAQRDQATFDATIGGKADEQDRAAVADYIKNNPGASYDQAAQFVLNARIANGENVRGSRTSSGAYGQVLAQHEQDFNDSGVGRWWEGALAGEPYVPFNKPEAATLQDITQEKVDHPFNALRAFTDKNYRVSAPGVDGGEAVRYVTDEEAADIKRKQGLMRRGGY